MRVETRLVVLSLATAALAACQTGGEDAASSPAPGTPSVAEQACLRDVTQTTNNPDVVLLESAALQGGSEVIVGVGEQRARWQCIGYDDGTTTGIMSLTDEGTL